MYLLLPNQRKRFRGKIFSEKSNFKDPAEIARSGVHANTGIRKLSIAKLVMLPTPMTAYILRSFTHKRNNNHSNK